jgi:ParB family transcriptional regulator, chromosome partitioning protein
MENPGQFWVEINSNRHTGKLASDMMSFASSTAEKFGMSKRQVERIIAAGGALEAEEIKLLRGAPRPVTLADLTVLAKIGAMEERRSVVLKLFGGKAKSAANARKELAYEEGRSIKVPVTPEDRAFQVLVDAWTRAPKAARRMFVDEYGEELAKLLPDARAA